MSFLPSAGLVPATTVHEPRQQRGAELPARAALLRDTAKHLSSQTRFGNCEEATSTSGTSCSITDKFLYIFTEHPCSIPPGPPEAVPG